VRKVALRNVLSKLASGASKAPPPVESAARVSVTPLAASCTRSAISAPALAQAAHARCPEGCSP
jgi:hypothetical protein